MQSLLAMILLGASLLALPSLSSSDSLFAVPAILGLGITTAVLCSGRGMLALALGALGSLAYVTLASRSPELGGALFVLGAHGARVIRGRTAALRGALALASLTGGAVAAILVARYAAHDLAVMTAATVIASLFAGASFVLPSDDALSFGLRGLAQESDEPGRSLLLRAVQLRRKIGDSDSDLLPAHSTRQLEGAWTVLLTAARARATAQRSTAIALDRRIARHVDALERIYSAAEERSAHVAGMDNAALDAARLEHERLASEISALQELAPATDEKEFTGVTVSVSEPKREEIPVESQAEVIAQPVSTSDSAHN
ncbi:MAG: hypothetical protein Q8Q09_08005 [Deltaproteobacteria bacterium]|nr:hypothetical protein [Deltaproteobacteria bacterium]